MGIPKPLKVLQLGSPTGLYGAERWILALIKHLDPKQVHTFVGVIRDDPSLEAPLIREAQKLGFETITIEAYGRFNLAAVKTLRRVIQQKGIHILHTHGYKQDLIGLLATRGTNCRILATPHGWSKEPDVKLWCYELLNRLTFLFLDAVVPLSEGLYQGLCRIPGLKKRLSLIPNGVDLTEIAAIDQVPQEIRDARGKRLSILGYIGQLIHRKGVDVLLRALHRLPQRDFKAFVIGEGPLRRELEALASSLGLSDQVVFTGYRPDRLNFLLGFDVFILPSRLEGIPRCLMEAMGMGKAVIASDIKGCRYLIPEEGLQGLLFPPGDDRVLAEKIGYLLANPSIREKLGREAQKFITTHYSAARMARDYQDLYFRLFTSFPR